MRMPFMSVCGLSSAAVVMMLAAGDVAGQAASPTSVAKRPSAAPIVPFPHPLITEVLYAVPTGDEGDADGDGTRSATGDEFVELINPHDSPINLKGYVLTDGKNLRSGKENAKPSGRSGGTRPNESPARPAGDDESRIRFVLPDIELKPGEVVVVFNGYTGTAEPKGARPASPAAKPDPNSVTPAGGAGASGSGGGATAAGAASSADENAPKRLSMGITSQFVAFSNQGDCVLLTDAAGKPVQCISWGQRSKPPEDVAPLMEKAPESRGSIVRVGLTKGLVSHRDRFAELFTPGMHNTGEAVEPVPAGGAGGSSGGGAKPTR